MQLRTLSKSNGKFIIREGDSEKPIRKISAKPQYDEQRKKNVTAITIRLDNEVWANKLHRVFKKQLLAANINAGYTGTGNKTGIIELDETNRKHKTPAGEKIRLISPNTKPNIITLRGNLKVIMRFLYENKEYAYISKNTYDTFNNYIKCRKTSPPKSDKKSGHSCVI